MSTNRDIDVEDLLKGKWDKIVLQGGDFQRPSQDNIYSAYGIWIEREKVWTEISASSTKGDVDEFYLNVYKLEEAPIPEPSTLNHPPRQEVTDKCPLKIFVGQEPTMIFDNQLIKSIGGKKIQGSKPLIIEFDEGRKLKIHLSERYPGNIDLQLILPATES
ncbi:MAG: hypothetical protein ABW146_04080 [Candidatus Sedimenticola sp. 6PFRAG7]